MVIENLKKNNFFWCLFKNGRKMPFLVFFYLFLFVRQTKFAITRPIFEIVAEFYFYTGPHYVDFTFAFDTTLIQLEMTEIWPK